jgi:prevent-host-death family protein
MIWVTVDEIERDLPGYLKQVQAGETVIVTQAGTPVAEIKPPLSQQRPFGLAKGEFVVPNDFDEPLPEHILDEFESR